MRVLGKLLTGALAVALLAAVIYVNTGPRMYVVQTGSMEPTIPVASAILVDPHQYPRPGQVVTFQRNGSVTTHRLMKSGATKGDANRTEDPWKLSQTKVLGTVQATVPNLGYLLVYLKQPAGLLSLLLLPLVLRLAWQITAPRQTVSAARPA
jgi:signal peptidase